MKRYVMLVGALACAGLGVATFFAIGEGFAERYSWWTAVGSATFVTAFYALGQTSFTFTWRGNRHRMVLDEVPLYIGLVGLGAPLVPILVGVCALLEQARLRRSGIKAVFNLSQGVLASAWAAVVFAALVAIGVAPFLAALPAAVLYPLLSNFLVAGVFSQLSGVPHGRVFADKFLGPGLLAGSIGAAGGVAITALWSVHPATILAVIPFVFLTYRYGVLAAAADRELDVHKRLAEVQKELVGVSDNAEAARRILQACGELFPTIAGAELAAEGEAPVAARFADAAPGARPVEEPVGGVGTLRLWPRTGSGGLAESERALVRIVAAQLSATIGQARALQRMETIARQEKLSALGTLVAGVAHEINNPITYMRGALELASMDLDEVDEKNQAADLHEAVEHARASLGRLAEGVDRVQRITHALKGVARQGNGERAPEDLRAIAEDVVQVVRMGLPKNVKLAVSLPEQLPRASVNASEMHQVVLNLVKNASEALSQKGGTIDVRAWAENGSVLVEVRDDGPGIPLEVQKRLFEPFFTTKRQGTGLGLSLSRGIVEAHGGELKLISAPGAGTTFTLRLPAAP